MNLLDHPPSTWGEILEKRGHPAYRGRQVAHWVYQRLTTDPRKMSNIPPGVRDLLSSGTLSLDLPTVLSTAQSLDGTVKMALRLQDGPVIESVLIPRKGQWTLCLSTQAGCGIGCRFCRTASMGLTRNLSTAEILSQWLLAARFVETLPPGESHIDHIVFMGMGEPLANLEALIPAIRSLTHPDGAGFSPRRITVSTSGLVPRIDTLGEANTGVRLAISLCAPDDALRREIMPVGRIYSIEEILAACRRFPLRNRDRITFEYVLLAGVNDSPLQARQLGRLLAPFRSKVNLIPFNPFPGSGFARSPAAVIEEFQRRLIDSGIRTLLRRPRGETIAAACGQLAGRVANRLPEGQRFALAGASA